MAHRLRWTRLALSDLVEIRDYIAADKPAAADAFVARIREVVEHLADRPDSGRIVPERRSQGYREVIVSPYRVVYAVTASGVQVLRVWHGRRLLP